MRSTTIPPVGVIDAMLVLKDHVLNDVRMTKLLGLPREQNGHRVECITRRTLISPARRRLQPLLIKAYLRYSSNDGKGSRIPSARQDTGKGTKPSSGKIANCFLSFSRKKKACPAKTEATTESR